MSRLKYLKGLSGIPACNPLYPSPSANMLTKLEQVALEIMKAKLKTPTHNYPKSSPQMALELLQECERLEAPAEPPSLGKEEECAGSGLIWCEDVEPSGKPRPDSVVYHIPLETEDGYITEEVLSTAQDIAEVIALKKHKNAVLNYYGHKALPPATCNEPEKVVDYILHIHFSNNIGTPQQVRHTGTSKARAVVYAKSEYPTGKLVKLEIVQQVDFDDIRF